MDTRREIKSFGKLVSDRRKELNLSQKALASIIAISPQYLNDIEHDRRSPSAPELMQQFAETLQLEEDLLYFLAGRIPDDLARNRGTDPETLKQAMIAFRKALKTQRD